MATNIVHINWEGNFSVDEVIKDKSGENDYGIYQIYGKHPIYGADSLLYIGIATDQRFSKRILEHKKDWLKDPDLRPVTVCLGDVYRQLGKVYKESEDFSKEEWKKATGQCEQLLIYALAPGYNSRNKQSINEVELRELHILNWGDHRNLFSEISGDRWTEKYGKE
ncbi:MAG: hypothetical protein WCF59_05835 [Desulfobaccales bacterium]